VLNYDLVQLRIHDRRDWNLSVVRAGGIVDSGDTECVSSAHFPWSLDDPRSGPEVEGVGNQ